METLPAIVFALREEIRPIFKEAKVLTEIGDPPARLYRAEFRGRPLLLCQTGIGLSAALEATGRMFRHFRPSLILSAGCAGGADPSLKNGDLLIPTEIRSETPTDRFQTDGRLRSLLELLAREEGLACRGGSLVSLWKMAGREAKKGWGEKGAAGVDMESAAVAAAALKKRIPFVSLRVIFDPADEELPFPEPTTEAPASLRTVFRNPRSFLQIPKFFRMVQVSRKNLARVLSRFLVISQD